MNFQTDTLSDRELDHELIVSLPSYQRPATIKSLSNSFCTDESRILHSLSSLRSRGFDVELSANKKSAWLNKFGRRDAEAIGKKIGMEI